MEVNGKTISPDIILNPTSSENWDTWASKTVSNIELNKGKQVLRVVFDNGEFNLGKMTFAYNSTLSYIPPVAEAGENVVVVLPETATTLDGSQSVDPAGETLTYVWEQIYGPSTINFTDKNLKSPVISNLEEGIYKCKLTVSDGTYSSNDFVLVIVSATGNTSPIVSISSPAHNSTYKEGSEVTITASANDLDGEVTLVEFYDGDTKIGEDDTEPFSLIWTNASIGDHEITAKATDNDGAISTSEPVKMIVDLVLSCTKTSSESIEGSFTTGYKAKFETVGTDVIITFELLDTDRSSGNAYLWQESPFAESRMDFVEANVFTKTLNGLTVGTTISYACKFEFTGGLAVTKYHNYVVGENCTEVSDGAILSDLKVNGQTIDGFKSDKLNYEVYLPEGTTLVPMVTGTASDPEATVVVANATSIPGTTTIVVTSENKSSSVTYSISFAIESYDINLALNKTVATSSDENAGTTGSNAVDGVESTRWASSFSDPNWIYVDLEASYNINQVVLIWEEAHASAYEIQISDDASNWSTIFSESSGDGGTDRLSVDGTGRYVRMYGITRATPYGYSLYELEVYGTSMDAESQDATLKDLKWNGVSIDGFSASIFSYKVELPFGTTIIPDIIGTPNDASATVSITNASTLPGTSNVVVTAEDGITTITYSVAFTLVSPSSDASLSDLKIDGITIDGFTKSTLSHSIELPFGTTIVPTVTVVETDPSATIVITDATTLPGTTKVIVTAEDGITTETYTISFTLKAPSTDASLIDLKVDGITINRFSHLIKNYSIVLDAGTSAIPNVTANPKDNNATVVINPPSSLPGTTQVVVTAQDGKTTSIYSIEFSIVTSIHLARPNGLNAYSFQNVIYVKSDPELKLGGVEVFTLSGLRILNKNIQNANEQYVIKKPGIVVLRITDESGKVALTKKLLIN